MVFSVGWMTSLVAAQKTRWAARLDVSPSTKRVEM